MPITITITDPTPEQLAALFGRAAITGGSYTTQDDAYKPKPARTTKKPATPDGGMPPSEPAVAAEDAELAAEIARDVAEAPPEPKGATAVVDAGTGKPMEASEPVELTMDMVRANCTRMVQKDKVAFAELLNRFGAAKLSEVKPDDLPDFAGAVLAALG